MKTEKLTNICRISIQILFILLFTITPFLFTSINSELFEFNKMIFVYLLTIVITFFWITRMILEKQIIFRKTILTFPLIIFYCSQSVSTIFSHDLYMSLFGYYSRFNQGLFALTAYLILYFAFTSNINFYNFHENKFVKKLLFFILFSAILVSIYGICQHFGIDYFHWVQDVKNRVFSTLGQPNWLGAYLSIILMIAFGIYLSFIERTSSDSQSSKFKVQSSKLQLTNKNYSSNGTMEQWNNRLLNFLKTYVLPLTIFATLYTTLLFTRSRSAFSAFHICFGIFTIVIFIVNDRTPFQQEANRSLQYKKIFFTIYLLFFLLINIFNIFPTPIEKLNGLTIPNLINKMTAKNQSRRDIALSETVPSGTVESKGEGGTESFAIRKIVWQGAWNTFLAHPIIGYGTETFALAYYRYKPLEQNLVSEWDFLYNKAHNEYLNYLATTGIIGFGSYMALIIIFTVYCLRNLIQKRNNIIFSLFLAWVTILITNFVGFSVIIISLYFYLLPAIIIVLNQTSQPKDIKSTIKQEKKQQWNNLPTNATHHLPASANAQALQAGALQAGITIKQWLFLIILLLATYYVLHTTYSWWLADTHYKKALDSSNIEEFQTTINLSSFHPSYHNEFGMTLSDIAGQITEKSNKTIVQNIANQAIDENNIALSISPENPMFWNYRALIFHNLAFLNSKYNQEAINSILEAQKLAPNDPKITYFAGIYYLSNNQKDQTLKFFEKTVKLKPNYIEPVVNLAKIYEDQGKKSKALKLLQNLLKYYPNNTNIIKLISEYKK
jgi:putative inorganic carbon (hco3(-)) transporter